MGIRKSDIVDADIIDSSELSSDGYSVYLTTSGVSTNSGTSTIVVNFPSDGEGILNSFDHPVSIGDIAYVTGTSGALGDGYFTITSIVSDTSFLILESIGTSTGGTVKFIYAPGASQVGFDPTGLTATNSKTVQKAIVDISRSIISTTLDYDFLLENDPPSPNNSYSNTKIGTRITQEKWRNTITTNKIKTIDYTYSGNRVVTEVRKIYDVSGISVVAQITINYTYTGTSVNIETITRDV